jgi:hypothetical protein
MAGTHHMTLRPRPNVSGVLGMNQDLAKRFEEMKRQALWRQAALERLGAANGEYPLQSRKPNC